MCMDDNCFLAVSVIVCKGIYSPHIYSTYLDHTGVDTDRHGQLIITYLYLIRIFYVFRLKYSTVIYRDYYTAVDGWRLGESSDEL